MHSNLLILGIETSCDETAAAVVDGQRRILSNVVLSQLDDHRAYGGVVPEIAARAHLDHLDAIVARAMTEAAVGYDALSGVAATAGPGLIGGVLVGATLAKAVAAVHGLPFLAVNHLEGHALTARLTDDVAFPYLLLLVSGGHCQLLLVEDVAQYRRLGTTIDDAVGEAFDKTAKLLGLGYPGGPAVERAAEGGDPGRFELPRPMIGRAGCDFSFSGLKTAVRRQVDLLSQTQGGGGIDGQARSDLAAGFQAAVAASLVDRTNRAIGLLSEGQCPEPTALVVAGGVAANRTIRGALLGLAERHDMAFVAPPPALCTDNAAMIAWAGQERLQRGLTDPLDFRPRPRWPLDPDAAPAAGAGRAKA